MPTLVSPVLLDARFPSVLESVFALSQEMLISPPLRFEPSAFSKLALLSVRIRRTREPSGKGSFDWIGSEQLSLLLSQPSSPSLSPGEVRLDAFRFASFRFRSPI